MGTWNACVLVECSGVKRICSKRPVNAENHGTPGNNPGTVDRKLDLLVVELLSICVRDP